MSKVEWLARIDDARAIWDGLAAAIDHWDAPIAPGQWSLKDDAAHLNAWRELTLLRLEAAAGDGRAPRLPWPAGMGEETAGGVDEINAWFHSRDRGLSTTSVLETARNQFERIRAAVEAIPKAGLEVRYDWLEGHPLSAVIAGMLEHLNDDHVPAIRAWIAEQTPGSPPGPSEGH